MTSSTPWIIDHVGIAVLDMNQAIALYASRAGTSVTLREKLEAQGVEIAFLNTGGSKVELLAALRPDTPIGRFLSKRGPGLHHICYQVSDIKAEIERLSDLGATLIDKEPRPGAAGSKIAFISPDSFSGVLTELCEYPKS